MFTGELLLPDNELFKTLATGFNPFMIECAYCGKNNDDAAQSCCGCGNALEAEPAEDAVHKPDEQEELVTLVTCQRLTDADLVVSRLSAAGIEAFVPDEFLMQNIGFNLNTYGYVRVQVHRKDLDNARELIAKKDGEA